MHINQEKKKREETDPKLREFMNIFSAKDAVLEQGIAKTFEQSVILKTKFACPCRMIARHCAPG